MAAKVNKGPREFFRKFLVSLKRKPHMIPLVMLALAFIYYSFNLTQIANTTALINGPHMGLAEFGTMLFSTLSLVCFLNAFPHRKKVNVFHAGADGADGLRPDLLRHLLHGPHYRRHYQHHESH